METQVRLTKLASCAGCGAKVGAAFAHNFGLASSANGPTAAGKIAVVIGLAAAALIACANTLWKKAD